MSIFLEQPYLPQVAAWASAEAIRAATIPKSFIFSLLGIFQARNRFFLSTQHLAGFSELFLFQRWSFRLDSAGFTVVDEEAEFFNVYVRCVKVSVVAQTKKLRLSINHRSNPVRFKTTFSDDICQVTS